MSDYYVIDNLTDARVTKGYDTYDLAASVCAALNIQAGPGGRYGIEYPPHVHAGDYPEWCMECTKPSTDPIHIDTGADLNDLLSRIESAVVVARSALANEAEGQTREAVQSIFTAARTAKTLVEGW